MSLTQLVASAVLARYADVSIHFLEHYGERSLTTFPQDLRDDLIVACPSITYYIATAKPGE